jgi:hypothetical protein
MGESVAWAPTEVEPPPFPTSTYLARNCSPENIEIVFLVHPDAAESKVDQVSRQRTDVVPVLDVPPLVPLADAAAALNVHPRTLAREAERGRLKVVTIGNRRFVTPAIIKEYATPR